MGRKGSWLFAIKKASGLPSKEKKDKKKRKSKGCFWRKNRKRLDLVQEEVAAAHPALRSPVPEVILAGTEGEQTKYIDSVIEAGDEQARQAYPVMNSEIVEENEATLAVDAGSEQARQAYPVTNSEIVEENPATLAMDAESVQERNASAVARASAAEAAVAASRAAAEGVRLTAAARSPAKSKEEVSALKIQSVYKGYMARRALRSIKGLVRLKTLIQGHSVKRQAITTLKCMQTVTRIQAEVRARRIRMSEENCAFQRQLQQKQHREEKSRPSIGDNWNGSAQSKEQFEAMQQRKLEAAIKRERTLAYAYSHQQTWRNSTEPTTQHTFMDPENPQWGWNWLERWMAVRPWENRAIEKEQINHTTNAKSVTSLAEARRDLGLIKKPSSQKTSPRQSLSQARPSVSTPRAKPHNARPQSNRKSVSSGDGDARSTHSALSDRCRRHSVTRDDESVASSSALPSYMVTTESARAKSRMSFENTVLAERDSAGRTKKRLSFETSPSTARRHSLFN